MDGTGANRFEPQRQVTRQEMAVLVQRARQLGKRNGGVSGEAESALAAFVDHATIAAWAKDALAEMVANALLCGDQDRLMPTRAATRAEMAQLLYRMMMTP